MPSTLSRAAVWRILPFALFMAFLVLRGLAPADGAWGIDAHGLYAAQTLAVAALLVLGWRQYGELARQTLPSPGQWLLAVVAGLAVFALWIRLDAPWMTLGEPTAAFKPVDADGRLDLTLVAFRLAGAALVVPLMEELFWRSFLMRWVQHPVFEGVDPRRVGLRALVAATFVFTLAHTLWLAAVIAGLVYALLYVRTGRLWVAVIAHAVTNGALGVWVVLTGQWQFW